MPERQDAAAGGGAARGGGAAEVAAQQVRLPGPVITGRYQPAPAAPSTYVRSRVVPAIGPLSAGVAAAAGRAGNAASPVEAMPAPRAAPCRTRRRLYSRVTIVNQTTLAT